MSADPKKPQYTIYCATCKVNGKKYVGQTNQAIWTRWAQHLAHAKQFSEGRTHRRYCEMTPDLAKYGNDAFELEVLEVLSDKSLVNEREVWWMMEKKSFRPYGYNKHCGDKVFYTPEELATQREKIIKNNGRSTKVSVIKDGKILQFSTIKEFCEHANITKHELDKKIKMGLTEMNGFHITLERKGA